MATIREAPGSTRISVSKNLVSEEYAGRALPRILTNRDMFCTFVIILFFITNVSNAVAGGPAGITYWILGALAFFIPCAIAAAQLAKLFPYEGSLYNWTYKAFGSYWSFFVTFCIWLPAPILIVSIADQIIIYIQGLNPQWLTASWQQGLVLIGLIVVTSFLALQRYRAIQHMVNIAVGLILFTVVLLYVAALAWLVQGHGSATNFADTASWLVTWEPNGGNIALYGVITLGYLGVNIPMNMGGEVAPGKGHSRYLFLGVIIVLLAYIVSTAAILIVQGQAASYNLFGPVVVIDMVLGKFWGNVAALCIMLTMFMATIVYNFSYARFLMVAGIDQRLPTRLGRLNNNRVPAPAIKFQAVAAIVLSIVFFLIVPYVLPFGIKPEDLALQVYFVAIGSATLIWTFGTIFLFFNLAKIAALIPKAQRILPVPVLVGSAAVGILAGGVTLISTLLNSMIPLIANDLWRVLVGTLTISILIVGMVVSVFASSEASWQTLQKDHDTSE